MFSTGLGAADRTPRDRREPQEPTSDQFHILSDFIIDCSLHGFRSNHAVRCSTVKSNLMEIRYFLRAAGKDH
ncbi:hypothetical protein PF003_g38190 [Phytophthora fragariae]|nr:hypothetical protein PF003_g38190 [Phytophthora fragariae]